MSTKALHVAIGVLATAAVACISGAASAGFYGSDFDPIFFNGTATFQIGDNCVNNGSPRTGQFLANSNFFNCTHVDLEASPKPVVFLHYADNSTWNLDFSTFNSNDSADMLLVAVIDGVAKGIFTLPIGSFRSTNPADDDYYFLQFVYVPTYSGGNQDVAGIESFSNHDHSWDEGYLTSVTNSVLLYDCQTRHFSLRESGGCTLASTAENVRFALIPEPGSIALLVGGLGAGWWTRRRKTRA